MLFREGLAEIRKHNRVPPFISNVINSSVVDQLASTIGKLSPKGIAAFRNKYSGILGGALRGGLIDQAQHELLTEAKKQVEVWQAPGFDAAEGFKQWNSFYEKARKELSPFFLAKVVSKFPKQDDLRPDWARFVLSSPDNQLIDSILSRRLAKLQDVVGVGMEDPAMLLNSRVLDRLVSERTKIPRLLWEASSASAAGRPGRPVEELLVSAFSYDAKSDATRWLLKLLAKNEWLRPRILRSLSRNSALSIEVIQHLITLTRRKTKRASTEVTPQELLSDWIFILRGSLRETGAEHRAEALVLAYLEILHFANSALFPLEIATLLRGGRKERYRTIILSELRTTIESDHLPAHAQVIVSGSDEIVAVIREYLAGLTDPNDDPVSNRTPSSVYHSFQGKREVIRALLDVLDVDTAQVNPLDAIEVALFSCGVRPIGETGAVLVYDSKLHRPERGAVLAGDSVRIVRPGRILGELPAGVILSKAVVQYLD